MTPSVEEQWVEAIRKNNELREQHKEVVKGDYGVVVVDGDNVPTIEKQVKDQVSVYLDEFDHDLDDLVKEGLTSPQFEALSRQEKEDRFVKTWSGRTQREKNKENPTPFDFKAKGDGVTNDTQAFIDLEIVYKDQVIDLLGKTYKVDRDFIRNQYVNGTFRIVGSNRGKGRAVSESKYGFAQGNGQKIGEFIPPLLNETDPTSTTICQTATFYARENVLFSQRVRTIDNQEVSIIEAWDIPSLNTSATTPLWTSQDLTNAGHQAIAVTRVGSIRKFWSTAGVSKGNERNRFITRFELNSSGVVSNIEYFKVFGDDFRGDDTTSLSIAPDGETLIVSGTHPTKGFYIRVFKASIFKTDGADYSKDYVYEWGYGRLAGYGTQNICTDGENVYILRVNATLSKCIAEIHALDGTFKGEDPAMLTGSYDSTLIPQHMYYEPECFLIDNEGRLCALISIGKKAGSNSRGSFTNIINTVYNQQTTLLATDGGRPLLSMNANRCIVHPESKRFSISYVGASGAVTDYFSTKSTEITHSSAGAVGFKALSSGAAISQFQARNSLVNFAFVASPTGNAGIINYKTNKYIIVMNYDSDVVDIQYPLKVHGTISPSRTGTSDIGTDSLRYRKGYFQNLNANSLLVYADNTTAKAGGLVSGDVYRTATGQLMVVY